MNRYGHRWRKSGHLLRCAACFLTSVRPKRYINTICRGAFDVLVVLLFMASVVSAQQLPNDIPDILANCPNVVAVGQSLTISTTTTQDCLAVKGTATVTARFNVVTIQIYPGGKLVCRPPADIVIRNIPPADAEQYGTGILNFGTFDCEGTPKTPWTRLGVELLTGQSTATFNPAPTGWLVGDQIACARSEEHGEGAWNTGSQNWPQPERFRLASGSGATWTLDHAAAFDHPAARNADGSLRTDLTAPCANLTRDVKIRSENPAGARGHIMHTGDAKVSQKYTEVRDMGRTKLGLLAPGTNQKGRYSLHHHMMSALATVTSYGNAVVDGTKWPFTVHSSHNGLYERNVVVGGDGSLLYTEVGDERDNIFESNLAMGVVGTGARVDDRCAGDGVSMGCEGSAIWMQGAMNRVRNNVAANALDCIVLWSYGNGAFQPIKEYTGNEALGCRDGVQGWELFGGGTLANQKVWNITVNGFYGYTMAGITLADWVIRGDPRQPRPFIYLHQGIWFGDYGAFDTVILRPDIQNMYLGIRGQYGISGGPRDPWWSWPWSKLRIQDGKFDNNVTDILWRQQQLAAGGGAMSYELRAVGNVHGSRSQAHVGRTGPLVSEQTGQVQVIVEDYQKDATQDFTVWSNENAPGGATTRAKILDKVTGASPPADPDSDGDGVKDSIDKCPGTPPGSVVDANGCVVPPAGDADGDGVSDALDKCPGTPAGTKVDAAGCPIPTGGDTQPPAVTIQAPATVAKPTSVSFSSTCTDNIGCVGMTMFVDGIDSGQFQNSAPWNWTFNSASYTAGAHVVRINGKDAAGNTGFAEATITVTDPTQTLEPPTVTVTPSTCSFSATANPPDSSGGWVAQFQRRRTPTSSWANHGQKDSVSPYVGTATLTAASWEFQAVWTKSGTATQTSPAASKGCQASR